MSTKSATDAVAVFSSVAAHMGQSSRMMRGSRMSIDVDAGGGRVTIGTPNFKSTMAERV